MISGSGQQFKILEAMSNMTPVITTSKGSIPLGLEHNKNVLVADTALEFAKAIILLKANKELRSKLTISANIFISKNYSWKSVVEQLEENIYNKI